MLNNSDFNFYNEPRKDRANINSLYNSYNSNNEETNYNQENTSIISIIIRRIKLWFFSITFVVKSIVAISCILWLLDLIIWNKITFYFGNFPYFTIGKFQIWRLITGTFITSGLLSLIFALIFWVSDGMIIEKQKGSVRYFLFFITHSTIIQILYDILYYMFKGISMQPNNLNSSGLWCYIIFEVTINCLVAPNDNIYILCIPYAIKAKYFPIIILLIFIIFSGFDLGMFVGVGYGFLYSFFLKNFFFISEEKIAYIESSFFSNFSRYNGFIKINDTSYSNQQPFLSNFKKKNSNDNDSGSEDNNYANNLQNNFNNFTPFSGRGISLGTQNKI